MKKMALVALGLACLAMVSGCGSDTSADKSAKPSSDASITVSAAASLQGAMNELKDNYIKAHHLNDNQINITYAGSGSLRQQIEQGAPSSIFVSADTKNMTMLEEKKLVEDVKPLTANSLVVIVPKDKPEFKLDNLANANRISLGTIDTVPAGRYAKDALTALNLWDKVESKVVYAKDVKAVGATIASGAADVGFVYKTDAMALGDKVTITEIVPSNLHKPILYPIAIISKQKNDLTSDFYKYLTSPEAMQILQKYGFSDVPNAAK